MKKYITISAAALGLLLLAVLVGCGANNKAKYGKTIPTDMAVTAAKQILDNPTDFEGKDVLVSGKITSECPSGGWVWLKDNSGEIYVNMHPTNVSIPQKVGSTVKAVGKVILESGRPQIVGYGLEF
jgi:uncharacterized protein YdeI (BOF family)